MNLETDDILIDRLVDGEMSPDDYRQCLARVEELPDGWRRLSLAFLESQAWKRELATIAPCVSTTGSPPVVAVKPVAHPTSSRPTNESVWPRFVALAAMVIVAFTAGLGTQYGKLSFSGKPTPSNKPAVLANGKSNPSTRDIAGQSIGVTNLGATGENLGAGEFSTIPVYELDDDRTLEMLSHPAIDRRMRRAFERMGYDVSEQRSFTPIDTNDGRRLVVPIDELKITPVSRRAY